MIRDIASTYRTYVKDNEELEEEVEGTLVEIRVLLKDFGERIKIEKLLKICPLIYLSCCFDQLKKVYINSMRY